MIAGKLRLWCAFSASACLIVLLVGCPDRQVVNRPLPGPIEQKEIISMRELAGVQSRLQSELKAIRPTLEQKGPTKQLAFRGVAHNQQRVHEVFRQLQSEMARAVRAKGGNIMDEKGGFGNDFVIVYRNQHISGTVRGELKMNQDHHRWDLVCWVDEHHEHN